MSSPPVSSAPIKSFYNDKHVFCCHVWPLQWYFFVPKAFDICRRNRRLILQRAPIVSKVVVKQDFTVTFVSSANSAASSYVHSHIRGLNFELWSHSDIFRKFPTTRLDKRCFHCPLRNRAWGQNSHRGHGWVKEGKIRAEHWRTIGNDKNHPPRWGRPSVVFCGEVSFFNQIFSYLSVSCKTALQYKSQERHLFVTGSPILHFNYCSS